MRSLLLLAFIIPLVNIYAQNIIWVAPDGTGVGTSRLNPANLNQILPTIPANTTLKLKKGEYILQNEKLFYNNVTIEGSYTFETDFSRDDTPSSVFIGSSTGLLFRALNITTVRTYKLDGISFHSIIKSGSLLKTTTDSQGSVDISINNCQFINCSLDSSIIQSNNQLSRIDLVIKNSAFIGNRTNLFGTVYFLPPGPICQFTMEATLIENNIFNGLEGGLINLSNPREKVQFLHNTFTDNTTIGSRASCINVSREIELLKIENCSFIRNQAQSVGPAIYLTNISQNIGVLSLQLFNTHFKGYRSVSSLIYLNTNALDSVNIDIVNTEISGNRCEDGGFINILHNPATPYNLRFTNSTIASNAFTNGLIEYLFLPSESVGQISAPNSIFHNNNNKPFRYHRGAQWAGPVPNLSSTFTSNPSFVNLQSVAAAPTALGDYRLTPGSPAINTGLNISYNIAVFPDYDLDRNTRFNGVIDYGAYEFGAGMVPVLICNTDTLEIGRGELFFADQLVTNSAEFDSVRILNMGNYTDRLSISQCGLFPIELSAFSNNSIVSTCTVFVEVTDSEPLISCVTDTLIFKQSDRLSATDCVINPGLAQSLGIRFKGFGAFVNELILSDTGVHRIEVVILYPCPTARVDTCDVIVKVVVEIENDPQRIFCNADTINLMTDATLFKENLINGSLMPGDSLILRLDTLIIPYLKWVCSVQEPYWVTLTIKQIGGFESTCSIWVIPERIDDNIILRELFYEELPTSCKLPYRYFFTNVEVDSLKYSNTETIILKVVNGTIIRVRPSGEPNAVLHYNISGCSFSKSLLVRGGSTSVNFNIKIDLYEIKLVGDPSKYIARARGVAPESLVRWGYISKADYSSAYLSSFASHHYTFLDDLKDTSDYILFVDISNSINTSCYTRYFDVTQGSIFSYRSAFSEPGTSESKPSITVFPNPGNGVINIKYNGLKTARARITLYTMQGVLVGSYAFSNNDTGDIFRIEDNNFAPGFYKLEFHDVNNNIFILSKYIKQ
jgi:hypothetical protein